MENEKELGKALRGKCALVTLGIWVTLQTEQSGPINPVYYQRGQVLKAVMKDTII